jgi:hypothetical protein
MRIGFKHYAEVTRDKKETFEAVQILQTKIFGKNSNFCAFGSRVNCLTVERLQISAMSIVLSICFVNQHPQPIMSSWLRGGSSSSSSKQLRDAENQLLAFTDMYNRYVYLRDKLREKN